MSRKSLVPISLPADPTLALEAATKQYVDNKVGGGSGFTYNQDARPTATAVGQTWFETDTGFAYVWTNDGSSTQWVQFAPGVGGGGGAGSGFTFVQDTRPIPMDVGDTWFDTSTAASGGTSWVAVNEGSGEFVWVQFAPGTATTAIGKAVAAWQPTGTVTGTLTPMGAGGIYNTDPAVLSINATNGTVTFLAAGTYRFGASLSWSGGVSAAAYMQLLMYFNGNPINEAISPFANAYVSTSTEQIIATSAGGAAHFRFASTTSSPVLRYGQIMVERII